MTRELLDSGRRLDGSRRAAALIGAIDELLTNAAKHSGAGEATVRLALSDRGLGAAWWTAARD